ncbi:MAG: hypothetical protein ABJE95_21735 [Byssovorax sp.]
MIARRRLLPALATFVVALGIQAGCVGVFGVTGTLHDAVFEMCQCPALQPVQSCRETLTSRLDSANVAVRSAWLDRYVQECLECANAPICLSESPTCSLDKCTIDAECCSLSDAGKATCESSHCKQP